MFHTGVSWGSQYAFDISFTDWNIQIVTNRATHHMYTLFFLYESRKLTGDWVFNREPTSEYSYFVLNWNLHYLLLYSPIVPYLTQLLIWYIYNSIPIGKFWKMQKFFQIANCNCCGVGEKNWIFLYSNSGRKRLWHCNSY